MVLLTEQPAEHSDFETESDGETEKEERTYTMSACMTKLSHTLCMADIYLKFWEMMGWGRDA